MQDRHAVKIYGWYLDLVQHSEVLQPYDGKLTAILRKVHRMCVAHHAFNLFRMDPLNVIIVQKIETLLGLFR